MRVQSFRFGDGADSACIVGATRGNEIQPLYICSMLVRALREEEEQGRLAAGRSITVIPAINTYSVNMGQRFWPTDHTDINRMFPGYNLGETTQRIAAGVFSRINRFTYGIQLASFYLPGYHTPHVRIMQTGFENPELARLFGLPYIMLRVPKPYDTATLNYNWQIWDTQAFSIYTGSEDRIDEPDAAIGVTAILDFLRSAGILLGHRKRPAQSVIVQYDSLLSVRTIQAGLFRRLVELNQNVRRGEVLAEIMDPYTGDVKTEIKSPADARVFFAHNKPLSYASSVLFKLIPCNA
jgi:predicted deacylase